jgi:glutaredoxin
VTFPQLPGAAADTDPLPPARVELLTRVDCHLCKEARAVVSRVVDELGERVTERDVDADPVDARRYGEQVPVVFVDGVQLDFWRVSESRLRAALAVHP